MKFRKFKKINILMIIIIFLVQNASAWGGLTHYSIIKDSRIESEISAANAPDAFADLIYGNNGLDSFTHEEIPNELYDPLGSYLYYIIPDKKWAIGWFGHTISDRSAHGTYLPGSPYINSNYMSETGVDTLLEHYKAEFGGDILSYWNKQGTVPDSLVVYPDKIRDAINNYDSDCGTNYVSQYDSQKYLKSFEALNAVMLTEQAIIDYKQDKKLQSSDWNLLIWAYRNYNTKYEKYYNFSVEDVRNQKIPIKTCSPVDISKNTDIDNMTPEEKAKRHLSEKMKIYIGKQLIDKGLIIPQEQLDDKTGAITITFIRTVDGGELTKEYIRLMKDIENEYTIQTGQKFNISNEIEEIKVKSIEIRDIIETYRELYQRMVEKGKTENWYDIYKYI